MKNICVLGANGMLGYAVTKYFRKKNKNVFTLTRNEYDIARTPISWFIDFLENKEIDLVINGAGVIKPRVELLPVEEILYVNSIFPRNLAKITSELDILCFHITTDCVYSGKKGNYSERDLFDAVDIYGMTKNAGEPVECMVLRTSIIGEEKTEKRSLLEWVRSQAGCEVNGFTNHYWNGVTTNYLSEIIDKIIIQHRYEKGIFHIYSPKAISKYKLLKLIDHHYDLGLQINPIEFDPSVNRTLNSNYSLSKELCNKSIDFQIKEMRVFFDI